MAAVTQKKHENAGDGLEACADSRWALSVCGVRQCSRASSRGLLMFICLRSTSKNRAQPNGK